MTEAHARANKKYRESVKRITVDFPPTEKALWEHLQSQPNKQRYIKGLIEKDMQT